MKYAIILLTAFFLVVSVSCRQETGVAIDPGNQPRLGGAEVKSPEQMEKEIELLQDEAFKFMQSAEYKKALECFNTILSQYPANPKGYITLYNIACAYSQLQNKAKAFEFLRKAIQSGYSNKAQIEKDSDLNFIRKDKEYSEILDSIK